MNFGNIFFSDEQQYCRTRFVSPEKCKRPVTKRSLA